jgi:hypothetical protein
MREILPDLDAFRAISMDLARTGDLRETKLRLVKTPDPAWLLETPPVGFEPTTGCLEGSCSIRLS